MSRSKISRFPKKKFARKDDWETVIRDYLESRGHKLVSAKQIYIKNNIRVYRVTTDKGEYFTITGYGEPPLYPLDWKDKVKEAELLLRYYLGGIETALLTMKIRKVIGMK